MLDLAELCSTDYYRLELKSNGPLSIWLHHFKAQKKNTFETNIKVWLKLTYINLFTTLQITTSEACGRFVTLTYKTILNIQVPLPIYVPAHVRIVIDVCEFLPLSNLIRYMFRRKKYVCIFPMAPKFMELIVLRQQKPYLQKKSPLMLIRLSWFTVQMSKNLMIMLE